MSAHTPIASFAGEYRWLSNFWPAVIDWAGHSWPTVEHAYQAAKTLDPAEQEMIRLAPTPGKAKRLGRRVTLRVDWDDVRVCVMRHLLELKFADPELGRLLMATAPAELVEGNTWGDRFWGVCDGVGHNQLGRLLMYERSMLRTSASVDHILESSNHGGTR